MEKCENRNIKVSIIVPIYNSQKNIARCLDHLVNQTLKEIEIILINDGSTDDSEKIILSYRDKYQNIKYYKQKNKGVSVARNEGIKRATGKYLCFCDSDDYYENDAMEKMYENSCDADVVISKVRKKIHGKNEEVSIGRCYSSNEKELKNIILNMTNNYMINQMWCKLFKNEIIKNNDIFLNPNLSIGEDLDWICRFFIYVKSIRGINDITYNYIVSGKESLSQKFSDSFFEQFNESFSSLFNLFVNKEIDVSILNSIKINNYWNSLFLINSPTCKYNLLEKINYIEKILKSNNYKEFIKKQRQDSLKVKIMKINNKYILSLLIILFGKIR